MVNKNDTSHRRIVRADEKHDHLPDYSIRFSDDERSVIFRSRGSVPTPSADLFKGALHASAYDDARGVAPGWDVRYIEQQWRQWCGTEEIEPKNPHRHYVKFCQTWFEKRGRP